MKTLTQRQIDNPELGTQSYLQKRTPRGGGRDSSQLFYTPPHRNITKVRKLGNTRLPKLHNSSNTDPTDTEVDESQTKSFKNKVWRVNELIEGTKRQLNESITATNEELQ